MIYATSQQQRPAVAKHTLIKCPATAYIPANAPEVKIGVISRRPLTASFANAAWPNVGALAALADML